MAATHEAAQAGPAPSSRPNRRHRRRILMYLMLAVAILAAAATGGAAWYLSSQVLQVQHDRPNYSIRVLAVRGHTVEITRTDDTMRPGIYSLQLPGGGRVTLGAIISQSQHSVVRQMVGANHGLRADAHVHFDALLYGSPAAFRLSYVSVNVPDSLGPMPAWYIPGRSRTWVVLVHGLGMSLTEGMRPLPTLARLGLPVLDLSYRNDLNAPASSDHANHLGATEWRDVDAGVGYALSHGARDVVLYGYSLGGSIVESFLHRSPRAVRVRAAVLDSPALDWNAVLDFRANQKGVPGLITFLGKQIVARRLGLSSLDEITRVRPGADFKVRTLLFQGTDDTSVPSAANASLARARSSLVTYVQVKGASHTQAWNANPVAYSAMLKAFLTGVLR